MADAVPRVPATQLRRGGRYDPAAMRPLSVALTVSVALAVPIALWNLAPPEQPIPRLGLPDCPAGAIDDLRGADALECWFDGPRGPWHVTWSLEIHDVTLVRLVAADPSTADEVARLLVEQGQEGAAEVLVYARAARGQDVRRVRWTPAGGYQVSRFSLP